MPDILTCIFTLAAADGKAKRSQAPMNVSLTCRAWRSLALNLTQLWSHLELEVSISCTGTQVLVKDAPLLPLWLLRSGTQPLDVSLRFICNEYILKRLPFVIDFARREATGLVQVLTGYQSRWRNVSIVSEGMCLPEHSCTTISHTPLLTWLELGHAQGRQYLQSRSSQRLVHDAAGVTGGLQSIYALDSPNGPLFPALRTLNVHFTSYWGEAVKSLLVLIRHAPNFVELKVDYPLIDEEYPPEGRLENVPVENPVSLAQLRILDWQTLSMEFTDTIAPHLSFPALEDVSLLIDAWIVTSLDDWLRAREVTPRITRLNLDFDDSMMDMPQWDPDLLRPLFMDMTSLRHLRIEYLRLKHETVWDTLLCGPNGVALLCPALEYLEVRWRYYGPGRGSVRADYELLTRKMVSCVVECKLKAILTLYVPTRKSTTWLKKQCQDAARDFRQFCGSSEVSVEGRVLEDGSIALHLFPSRL